MSLHERLQKEYRWYRRWHHLRYVNTIHTIIVLPGAVYVLYLALEIHYYITLV
jgi:hypothetical protein